MSLNCSEISTYEEMNFELKNVQNVLGILLKTILKSESIVSIRTSIPKFSLCYTFLIHCLGIFGGKINIENTSENIKCGNLPLPLLGVNCFGDFA